MAIVTVEIPEPTVRTERRVIETFIPTNRDNIFLLVQTRHDKDRKFYCSDLNRVELKNGFVRHKIDAARFSDVAPVREQLVATGRYSPKALRESYERFLLSVEANLGEAIVWAERY